MSSPTASNRTLVIAFAANLGIAVSKFVAAAITGSSAMLTEGVHSVVDFDEPAAADVGPPRRPTTGRRIHPFGYGRELYFWSFVVAVMVFALGAGVSIYEGVIHIPEPEHAVSPIVAYMVLLVAFLLEGWSTLEAFREFKASKGKLGWFEAIRRSKDPPAFIVLLENGAAMAGIVAAMVGVLLAQLTGNPFYDGAASVVIGIILGITAFVLAYESKGLLIGEAADPELVRGSPRTGLQPARQLSVLASTDRPFLARPDHRHDERRFPRRDARWRRRGNRLRGGAGSAGALARGQPVVRTADPGFHGGSCEGRLGPFGTAKKPNRFLSGKEQFR